MFIRTVLLSLSFILSPVVSVFAQENTTPVTGKPAAAGQVDSKTVESDEAQTAALAKAAQNPIANLISFPLQNNTAFGIGDYNRTQNVLNIQPVIPLHLTKDWNLITRTILPVVWQPNDQPTQGWFGFGDLNPSLFLSPAKASKLIWGAGPAIVIPTATADQLGQGKLSLGPGVVALSTPGHWVVGVLVNNVWSVAGSGGRPAVNQMLLQYFVNYNMKKGWYLSTSPIVTSDWKAASGNQWTVPVGGGVGRIMKLGFQPVNILGQFYGNAVHQDGAASWSMRLQVQLSVSQVHQGTGEDDHGEETEGVGRATAASNKEVNCWHVRLDW